METLRRLLLDYPKCALLEFGLFVQSRFGRSNRQLSKFDQTRTEHNSGSQVRDDETFPVCAKCIFNSTEVFLDGVNCENGNNVQIKWYVQFLSLLKPFKFCLI